MKKLYALLLLVSFVFTSCSLGGKNVIRRQDDKAMAKETLEQIITAIQEQDKTALKNIFSQEVRENEASNMDESIPELMDFFQGEVLAIDDSAGVGQNKTSEYGRKKIEVISAFGITTSEREYYIAMNQYTVNTFDPDCVGVSSFYIVLAEHWNVPYVFRGGGKYTPGIHIVNEKEAAQIISSF